MVALLSAFSYLELVGKYQRAAGAALYTHKAFKLPFLTFMVAFAVMASGLASAGASAVSFGGKYLQQIATVPGVVASIAFLAVIAAVNYRGVGESVKINVVLTCVELSGLLIVIVAGAWAVLNGQGEPARLVEFHTSADTGAWLAVTSATSLAFFAMVGFEDSVNMVEECKDPVRSFPRALLVGMSVTGLIYVLVAIVSSLLLPYQELAKSTAPLLEVVRMAVPSFPLWFFSLIALFAVANSSLINMLMASRLVYGMASERIIPKVFATVHPKRRTPWVAILFTSSVALVLVLTANVEALGSTTALLLLCVFTLVNVAVLMLRRDKVDHAHFRTPTVLPVVGALASLYLASPLAGRSLEEYRIAGILLLSGLVLWGVNWFFVRRVDFDPEKINNQPDAVDPAPERTEAGSR